MNLIEALRQANGKPVKREGLSMVYSFRGATLVSVFGAREPFCPSEDWLLADDWYVVEPKSKIEEAIEREVKVFWNNEKAETMYSMDTKSMLRRVVNLALDEAKKAVEIEFAKTPVWTKDLFERIDALKVKE